MIDVTELRTLPLDPVVEAELDRFEDGVAKYLAGEIDDDAFRVFRLNQGIYGQRQGGHNQMVRVEDPARPGRARPARDVRPHRRRVLAWVGPPHDAPERAVPLRAARAASPKCSGCSPRSACHQPRGVRRHRAQRLRLPSRRGVPLRGARHQPVGAGGHRPVPAQPDRAAPPAEVQDQLLGLRDRLRPGDVQRRRRHRGEPPAPRRHARARLPRVPRRRARREPAPRAAPSRSSPRASSCSRRSRRSCACRTTTATATTSCGRA